MPLVGGRPPFYHSIGDLQNGAVAGSDAGREKFSPFLGEYGNFAVGVAKV
jgi:hypothetical protein